MGSPSETRLLHQLAHLYGVQTVYSDVSHHRRRASVEALLAVLRSLGAPIVTLNDVPSAWREQQQELWQRPLEPVAVAWAGEPPIIKVRLPSTVADAVLVGHLTLENGERQRWEWRGADMPVVESAEVEGAHYVVKQLPLSNGLPWGYHRFTLELPGSHQETLIVVAPSKAYLPSEEKDNHIWGVFLPLYALQTQRSWGSGDFSDLEAMMTWCAEIGSRVVATLPLLPTFLGDGGFEPSPYLPVSRLLWNEFYLDITRVPELDKCQTVQALLSSSAFQKELKALRSLPLVDYHRQMALKRQVLEQLCQCLSDESSHRLQALMHFAEANPLVAEYACFRATGEKQGAPWQSWPQRLREGVLKEGDYNEKNRRYHLYVQWLAQQQIQALSEMAHEKGVQLYLDLPLGVHPDGYDVWRERDVFAGDASTGAPPDAVFTKGQNWGFPPLHPERIRQQGYRYFIAYLRHHLWHSGILRIDHVMGLHRLFWIPRGLEASHGIYVRYPTEELYAILALESHRNKTVIVGEDLGTVPREVRPTMTRHGLNNMYVLHYELASNPGTALRRLPSNSVASLNTHDMHPFAAFWQGLDIKQRLEFGLLDKTKAQRENKDRRAIKKVLVNFLQEKGWIRQTKVDAYTALKACLASLSISQARVVLVNLEDLWLETQPQNIPSTKDEYPNWQRKARYSFETFCQMSQVIDTLRMIDHLRKQVSTDDDSSINSRS
jgi:4-alpha-glucanotransferase